MFLRQSILLAALHGLTIANLISEQIPPTVILDDGIFIGSAFGSVNGFLGIPFAKPPVGQLRLQLPQPNEPYHGVHAANATGPSCPLQNLAFPSLTDMSTADADLIVELANGKSVAPLSSSEDCLTVDIYVPATAVPGSNLPVVVWSFGSGFEAGYITEENGSIIVEASIAMNQPIIWVAMNYRMNGFGFLASQEVKDAGVGNLGLQDQRQALRWVQKYIRAFGGDPAKVTIWGESAGAMSVSLQMLTNGGNTEGLFRGVWMESGSPIPVGDITLGQPYYDSIVNQTGCYGASDTLECLRGVSYQTLLNAIDNTPNIYSYQALALAWMPRVDGVFLEADPQTLIQQGSVANVSFVTGDCDDEGTLFSFSTTNITTDDQLFSWLKTYWFSNATDDEINILLEYYPANVTVGSPFNTSDENVLTPQFKRIAAFQGDAIFQGPRRFFLEHRSNKQDTWSYLSKRFKWAPYLGSFHTSDEYNVYGPGEMTSYLVRFVSTLDPNGEGLFQWPKYTTELRNLLTYMEEGVPLQITQDVYRVQPIAYVTNLTLAYPL